MDVLLGLSVVVDARQPAEVAGLANRPEQGSGLQLDLVDDLVHQLQRAAAGAVPLVHDGHDRQTAGLAHAEQLQRLRLQALRAINEHHRGIHGGQNSVGILRKVRVARRIDKVDHEGLAVVTLRGVLKLQRGGGDGNATVFFHVHPVGDGGLAAGLAVYGAGLLDHVGVQRERLGEGGFTGIRVGDDGECAAARGFGCG